MRKFEFGQTFEEIEIAGDVYKLDFSDEKIQEFQRAFATFQAEIKELDKLDVSAMTDEEALAAMDKQKDAIRKLITILFGEGTFEQLYEKAGKSLFNMANLMSYIAEIFQEKAAEMKPDKRAQYVKNLKNKVTRKRA